MREAVLARPYLAVSIQGPQGAAQLVCVGQSQSGGLRFSQQFSGCLCVGGGSSARICVTFNMVEAGPIAYHLLRDSQRGRKSVTCGWYYQCYFQTVSPLRCLEGAQAGWLPQSSPYLHPWAHTTYMEEKEHWTGAKWRVRVPACQRLGELGNPLWATVTPLRK